MKLRIVAGHGSTDGIPEHEDLLPVVQTDGLLVEATSDVPRVPGGDGRQLCVLGHPVGWRSRSGSLEAFTPGRPELGPLTSGGLASVRDTVEGRYALVLAGPGADCELAADRFGQMDLYYQQIGDLTVLGTDLSLLPVSRDGAPFDQAALAHALTVFAWRPPKRHTIYTGVKRLGVDERFEVRGGAAATVEQPFVPTPTGVYGEAELDEYARSFLEAVEIRGSRHGNVVYLSSGWDSTAVLGCLVKLFGRRRVRAVIGRMRYAERSGVINQVEVDRARAIASYYRVPLDIVEFDYATTGPEDFERIEPVLRAHNIGGLGALNHWRLAAHVARTSSGDESVFAGEISDGAHNLGFSQFLTIFHPSFDFREYSDKMGSYLFGPSFMQRLVAGDAQDDPIYQLFRDRAGDAVFDDVASGDGSARRLQLLSSFFLRANRLPLWSLRNSRFLKAAGRDLYASEMESTYLNRAAAEATPETLYSWYLHLYNSFHWQGSTVSTIALTAELNGLRMEMPFWDNRLQDFLAAMPESWGRGLDLNTTKYPLKWMLKNRIDYPMHLQTGPHSYLYDVNPRFSLAEEVLYGSAFVPQLRSALKKKPYRHLVSDECFDVEYMDGLADRYVAGTPVEGVELSDLTSLCWSSIIGAYGV